METLIDNNKEETVSKIRTYSIILIIMSLLVLDKLIVRVDGDYIIIGDTVLSVGDFFLLFILALAIIALMRPMEQKKFQKKY